MPTQAQLEIITPSGEMEFHDLDPARGVANIGRDPDNDIVLDSPGVAPFHAILDHRQRPYQLMLLAEGGETRLRGELLATNVFQEVHNWDTIEIDGYSIILLEGEVVAAEEPPAAVPLPEVAAPVPVPVAVPPPAPEQAVAGALLPDLTDDVILTDISAREWTVDVEQTASFQVSVINGGDIVAAFDVQVEGVDASWVTVTPAQFKLNERAQTTVTVSITPPRESSSRAGTHPLAVLVRSPNYPGHLSRLGAVLVINPYYEFFVGELSPKQQTVSWFRRTGQVTVPIGNRGNSETPFRLDAEDDERGCRFEFEVPGEEVSLVKQAEVRLAPDETYYVPVQITPVRRRLIALRSRQYAFTITAAMVEGAQTPRAVMGRVKATPLIGAWLLLLIVIGIAALILFLWRPTSEPLLTIDTSLPEHEAPVTLSYDARRFPSLSPTNLLNHQNAFFLRLVLEFKSDEGGWEVAKSSSELNKPVGSATDIPLVNGRYRLRAENWISGLLPMFEGVSREVQVFVTPLEPVIEEFGSDKEPVWAGEEVTLFWNVVGAETLKIEYGGIEETLQDTELESGQRSFVLDTSTTFNLIASNTSWPVPVQKPLQVTVLYPTVTPVPTPVILRFDVDPLEITAGETVRIDWEVTGADSVSIDPLDQGLPVKGNIGDQPPSLRTYQLIAYKSAADGTQVQNSSQLKEVIVNPEPSATPEPVAPEVQLFEVVPDEVVAGDNEAVKLTWSVSGATTNIEITAPDFKVTGLESQDVITVTIKETTLFVLTAYNGELNRSAAAEVAALEPTPTPTLTPIPTEPPPPPPTETPEPTPTPFPPPAISWFNAKGSAGHEDKVVFQRTEDSANGPVHIYRVEAGAQVNLGWGVNGAEVVTLGNLGTQPAEGSLDLPEPVVQSAIYVLTAENNGGLNKVQAFVQLDVAAPPAPPPPPHVTGEVDTAKGQITVKWSYRRDDEEKIIGFRIYRADVPPGNSFVAVWAEYEPTARQWVDSDLDQTCGKAYYVVALYMDLVNNVERETAASSTSWYSPSCP